MELKNYEVSYFVNQKNHNLFHKSQNSFHVCPAMANLRHLTGLAHWIVFM